MNPWLSVSRRLLGVRIGVSTKLGVIREINVLRAERALLIAKNHALRETLDELLCHEGPLTRADVDALRETLRVCT